MKTISARRGKPGFTLIELMAVITIVVILAALVVGGMAFVQDRQAKDKARVQLALLAKALEDYNLDMGHYPYSSDSQDGSQNSEILYKALFYEGYEYTNAATPPATWEDKATKIYLAQLDPTSTKQGWVDPVTTPKPPITTKIRDPWGNEYRYLSAKVKTGGENLNAQNPDFDLWSVGKNGRTKNSDPKHVDSLDDIRN
jgi:prepilin-type N-terminal cleavage/methylation domain-containing protein